MKAVLSIGIAKASAQSLIKTCFGALHMCDSPFLELERKWYYKLLCNELIWSFPYNIRKKLERLHFGLSAKDATQLCLYSPHVGRLRKVLVCFFPWAWSLGPPSWPGILRSDGAEGKAVGRQCQPADAFISPENLEVQRAVVESFAIRGTWVWVLTCSLISCVTLDKYPNLSEL